MSPISRRQFVATVGLTALAGCTSNSGIDGGGTGGGGGGAATDGGSPTSSNAPLSLPTADEQLPLPMSASALRGEAQSGGPPKDGIPSIDSPKFVGAEQANFLDDGDPVFGVARDGVAKAYPQKILVSHEIVNDDLAGTPVSVTYCPLTGTVQGFNRGNTTFGVSGRLINSNLVMYDRKTEAWWPQILATSIPSPWNEGAPIRSLTEFRLVWTTWKEWRALHPDTRVLSTRTGFARNYNDDPYGEYNPKRGYYVRDDTIFPGLDQDDRYAPKTVVMGARTPDGAAAFLKESILQKGVMTGEIGSTPVVAVHDPRLSTAYVYANPDGESFEFDGGQVTASDGTSHAPDDLPLDRIHTFDAMWFAWAGYYPDTNVYA